MTTPRSKLAVLYVVLKIFRLCYPRTRFEASNSDRCPIGSSRTTPRNVTANAMSEAFHSWRPQLSATPHLTRADYSPRSRALSFSREKRLRKTALPDVTRFCDPFRSPFCANESPTEQKMPARCCGGRKGVGKHSEGSDSRHCAN